jgi:SPP1 family predicted phage head-tail adaptor
MLNAGKLRHRLELQKLVDMEDSAGNVQDSSGAIMREWETFDTVWGAVEYLKGKELIAAQSEQTKVFAKVTLRARNDLDLQIRVFHISLEKYYNVEAVLRDDDSGQEYVVLHVSEGIRYINAITS